MLTKNQLLKNSRKKKKLKNKTPALKSNPQCRGICIKTFVINPKKPNSAKRKVARVRLTTDKEVTAYIPGEAHSISEHSSLLIRGGRTKDLPGLKYKVIRGSLDVIGVSKRTTSRSKYGVKKPLKKYV